MATKKSEPPKPEPVDMINEPPHYQSADGEGIQCIDAARAMLGHGGFIAAMRFQILKYNWRLDRKEDPEANAAKLKWYLEKLQEEL
jgi:hypothetical protein